MKHEDVTYKIIGCAHNVMLQASGTPVAYIKIKKLRPKILSRMEGVSVKVGRSG